jgi:hypothetical protein
VFFAGPLTEDLNPNYNDDSSAQQASLAVGRRRSNPVNTVVADQARIDPVAARAGRRSPADGKAVDDLHRSAPGQHDPGQPPESNITIGNVVNALTGHEQAV